MAPECGSRLVEISYPPCGVGRIDRRRQGIENLSKKVVTQVRLRRLGNDKARRRPRTRVDHNVSHCVALRASEYRNDIKTAPWQSMSGVSNAHGRTPEPFLRLRHWCFSA